MCIQFTLDFICHFMTKSFSVLRSSCYSLWSTPVLTVLNLEGRILDAGFCGQSNSFPQFVSVFFFVRFLSVFNWLGKPALLYRGSRLFALKLKKKKQLTGSQMYCTNFFCKHFDRLQNTESSSWTANKAKIVHQSFWCHLPKSETQSIPQIFLASCCKCGFLLSY